MKMTIYAGCSQPRTITYRVLCMALLVFSSGVLTAQKDEHRVRNVVLVHGAWADGSGWRGVYDILTKDGSSFSAKGNSGLEPSHEPTSSSDPVEVYS